MERLVTPVVRWHGAHGKMCWMRSREKASRRLQPLTHCSSADTAPLHLWAASEGHHLLPIVSLESARSEESLGEEGRHMVVPSFTTHLIGPDTWRRIPGHGMWEKELTNGLDFLGSAMCPLGKVIRTSVKGMVESHTGSKAKSLSSFSAHLASN